MSIANEIKSGKPTPSFAAMPVLESISTVDAAVELIGRFRARAGSVLLERVHASSGARPALRVARDLENIGCHRLQASI